MKKICILTPLFFPVPDVKGGAIENLITILINQNEFNSDYIFDVYTVSDSKIINKYKNANIHQIELSKLIVFFQKCINKFFNIFKIDKYYDFNKLKYKKIIKKINYQKYDSIIVENNMQLYKYIFNNIKNKKIPFYFHLHNDLNEQNKTLDDYQFILNTSKKIIVVSNFLKNKLKEYGNEEKIVTLPNVIDKRYYNNFKYDLEKYNNLKEMFDLNNNIVIGYVGRPDKEKGILELIKAFNMLKKGNIKLLLISDDFTKLRYKKGFVSELEKEYLSNKTNIKISGRVDYKLMPLYYKLIDIVVIPTICEEAFGMVALEAKTLNKKIVYSNSGALNEILNDAESDIVQLDKNFILNLSKTIQKNIDEISFRDKKNKLNDDRDCLKEYYDDFIKIISI